MRRALVIVVALAAALLAAAPAHAQYGTGQPLHQIQSDQPFPIKPSQAVRIALDAVPSAQPLGVQLRGSHYIVKLKQGNRVIKLRVHAGTGAIQ